MAEQSRLSTKRVCQLSHTLALQRPLLVTAGPAGQSRTYLLLSFFAQQTLVALTSQLLICVQSNKSYSTEWGGGGGLVRMPGKGVCMRVSVSVRVCACECMCVCVQFQTGVGVGELTGATLRYFMP